MCEDCQQTFTRLKIKIDFYRHFVDLNVDLRGQKMYTCSWEFLKWRLRLVGVACLVYVCGGSADFGPNWADFFTFLWHCGWVSGLVGAVCVELTFYIEPVTTFNSASWASFRFGVSIMCGGGCVCVFILFLSFYFQSSSSRKPFSNWSFTSTSPFCITLILLMTADCCSCCCFCSWGMLMPNCCAKAWSCSAACTPL